MPPHRVVALVSGGKDSCYSMMKCVAHGHEIVAIANLHPPAHVGEELDSFMYQTVGHAHIGAIAEAMELPLFRREIVGTAVEQGLRYGGRATAGDEVEDLHALLAHVQAEVPGVSAVCSGAILSNYQRSRVESVCERLGLASLAYLWQREQAPLLDEMINHRIDAVLVKVASLGLTSAHLGRSLSDLRGHFHKLEGRFGFHVCGEGGEYETFTLDCPLFKRRLEPHDPSIIACGGGASVLSFEKVTLVPKEPMEAEATAHDGEAARADDDHGAEDEGEDELGEVPMDLPAEGTAAITMPEITKVSQPAAAPADTMRDLGGGLVHVTVVGGGDGLAAPAQLSAVIARVRVALASASLDLSHVLMTRLYVDNMSEYATVNAAFASAFAGSAPAARLAVELPLAALYGDGCHVAIEVTASGGEKNFLHVQSISEWAPRMIGPYCQLTVGHGVAYVAGSIGLVPAEMQLASGGAAQQTRTALDNCAAVLKGLSLNAASTLSLVIYIIDAADAPAVQKTAATWLRRATQQPRASAETLPPIHILQISALPMGALVEVEMQAAASAARLCPTHRWASTGPADSHTNPRCELRCDAVFGAPQAAPATAPDSERPEEPSEACCSAFLFAPSNGAHITLDSLCHGAVAAIASLDTHLRAHQPSLCLHPSLFIRVYLDAALQLRADQLSERLSAAIADSGLPLSCAAIVLPVVRVLAAGGGARAMMQVHSTTTRAHARAVTAAVATAVEVTDPATA